MSSALHQISISFDAEQDRLLLRLKTQDLSELRLWLTRRYVKLLWPMLGQLMSKDPIVAAQPEPGNQEAVLAFRHEEAISQANFSAPYQEEVRETPLGEAPILVSRISINRPEPDTGVLSMHPQVGQGVDLALDASLLHSFARLLSDAVTKTDWDLQLNLPSLANVEPPSSIN